MPALRGQPAIDYLKSHGLYDSLEKAVGEARYEVKPDASVTRSSRALRVENPAQGMNATFDSAGFSAQSSSKAGDPWKLSMRPVRVGYEHELPVPSSGEITTKGARVEIRRQGLTEWYVNRPSGIEQGFTLESRPDGASGGEPLRLVMELDGNLQPRVEGSAVTLARENGSRVLRYDGLSVQDASGRMLASAFETEGCEVSVLIDDSSATYPVTIDPLFSQVAKLTASDGAAFDYFGSAVAISGDTAVVGAWDKTVGGNFVQGSAYVFQRNNGGADSWGQVAQLKSSDAAENDVFGISVAISGDTAIVGAQRNAQTFNASGSAYIFERNAGGANNWGQVAEIAASTPTVPDFFGASVAIDRDTAVVGASGYVGLQGAAYVFGRNVGGAENWGQLQQLTASDGAAGDFFGTSVSIDGDTAVVGAVGIDSFQGAAYVYERNSGGAENWGQVQKLTASDGAASDEFGWRVAVRGDTAVASAPDSNAGHGAAYVFARNTGGADNWGQVRKLTASDGADNDGLGFSVALDGDTAVVGAINKTVGGNADQGAAYVFGRNSGGADNWGQVAELTSSDGAPNDNFGWSVSIDDGTAIVGAIVNSQNGAAYVIAVGCNDFSQLAEPVASDGATDDLFGLSVSIDGDTAVVGANGHNATEGEAYVFERNSGGADAWGQVRILTASDRAQGNAFGTSVSIDRDTIVVGSTNNGDFQGAAYVFERNSGGADNWGEVAELTASDGATGDRFGVSVSIDGDTIVVGSTNNGSFQGAAYVFERNSGGADNWGEVAELTTSDGAAFDHFGFSVSVDGDTAVVGAVTKTVGGNVSQGAAYVFDRNTGGADNWGEVAELTAPDGAAGDRFGFSVSLDEDTAVVGAYTKSSFQGAAYVFERNSGGADNWGQVKELTASDGSAGDGFARSVSIDEDTAVVGAPGKSSQHGAAYVYERNSGGADNWGQVRELTAFDGAANDEFGLSVSIDGDTVVAGVPGKTVGGNSAAGAAYVFGCDLCNTATSTTVTPASTDYSDPVDLSATVTSTATVNTGTVKFSIVETGDVVGTASVVNGTATLAVASQALSATTGHYPDLAANTYTIKAEYSGVIDVLCASSNTGTLTVSREAAVVTPSASNPLAVKVNSPGGTAGPITLCADITEALDDAGGYTDTGDISLAVPVSVTLTPVLGSGTIGPLTATTSGGGIGGTLHACRTFPGVPVNVYDVNFSIGGNYYTGSDDSVLAVYDPSLGFTTGGGRIINPNTGNPANFGFNIKYQKRGSPQGSILYLEHNPGGAVTKAKSNSMQSVSIVQLSPASWGAVFLANHVVFNGVGNYSMQVTAIDKGEPGNNDQFGLKLVNPNKTTNATYTFAPQTLLGGNIQVPHK